MKMRHALLVVLILSSRAGGENPLLRFVAHTIDPYVGKICYAVALADVDGDGSQDIVAVSENRVLWYQHPTWKRRVIIEDQTPRDNVCIAPLDVDADGQVDFALGAGWTKTGTIHLLRRNASLDTPWQVDQIGEERWLHRMRWADVLGKGQPQLVISPLNATVGAGVRLTALEIPAEPSRQRWPGVVLNGELDRMHNHWHVDFDRDGTIDTLTASREGVHLVQLQDDSWSKVRLGAGASADEPNQNGAGEVKMGQLSEATTFIATVEPMHGSSLVVYTAPESGSSLWRRHVVDQGFQRGHALWTADMDGDGSDEIVFGHSDTPQVPGVNVYDAVDDSGTTWQKHVVDAGGMATEDLVVADLTGDGLPDIVAGGRATHNLKLYVNVGKVKTEE